MLIRSTPQQGEFAKEPGVNVLYGLRYQLTLLRRDDREHALAGFYGQLAQGMTRDTFIGGEGSRFFRFHARYGAGAPDGKGLAACIQHKGKLRALSSERVRQELFKLLEAGRASETVRLMASRNVLKVLFAHVSDLSALERMAKIDMETLLRQLSVGQAIVSSSYTHTGQPDTNRTFVMDVRPRVTVHGGEVY